MQNNQNQYDNELHRPAVMKSGINGMGIAGFVLSILAMMYPLIMTGIIREDRGGVVAVLAPTVILLLLAVIFSIIGLFKRPRAFAIAGICISIIFTLIAVMLM